MMGTIYDRITEYCVCNGIVDDSNTAWLRYCIEKKVATLLCGIPFLVIAVALSNVVTAISFFVGFYELRRKAGGFHAKTIFGCFFASIFIELVFLGIFSPRLNLISICIITAVDALVFFLLAPYNHPNMHLSNEEVFALKRSTRTTVVSLIFVNVFSLVIGFFSIANGLTTGATMAAAMLCTANINDWRISHENCKKQSQRSIEESHGKDGPPRGGRLAS